MSKRFANVVFALFALCGTMPLFAEEIDLPRAIERALAADPRIREQQFNADFARAQLAEAHAADDLQLQLNTFLGLAPALKGNGVFTSEGCGGSTNCDFRSDRFKLSDGVTPWHYLQASLIKPLATFGKIENYATAATHNIEVKEQGVRLQRGEVIKQVKQAYYGYIAAYNTGLFLNDVRGRLQGAQERVQKWLDEDEGKAKQSDLFAVQTAMNVVDAMIAAAKGLENVALTGLRVLVGAEQAEVLTLRDTNLEAIALPPETLDALKDRALSKRPEMAQVESGLQARRALVDAEKAMARPNLYAGIVGYSSYAPGRDRIDNPVITDPFNDFGSTPIIGLQWHWEGGKADAKAAQAKAELNALLEKSSLARAGIPFEVAESYHQAHAYYDMVTKLREGTKTARRWMISTFTDFNAGVEESDKLVSAFQGYVLANTEYIKTVYAYNMHVAQLQLAVGAYE